MSHSNTKTLTMYKKKIFISKYRYWSVFNPSELDVHLTLLNDSRLLLSELSENKVMFPKCLKNDTIFLRTFRTTHTHTLTHSLTHTFILEFPSG